MYNEKIERENTRNHQKASKLIKLQVSNQTN